MTGNGNGEFVNETLVKPAAGAHQRHAAGKPPINSNSANKHRPLLVLDAPNICMYVASHQERCQTIINSSSLLPYQRLA